MDYFTKWIEEILTQKVDHHVVMRFLTENIFTKFGCPHKLVTDNAAAFKAKELVDMCDSMSIKLVHSTSYYPQGKGDSPFRSVYGTEAVFLIQLTLPVAKFLQEEQEEEEDMAERITDLAKVHQIREQLVERSVAHQKRIKEDFDRKAKINNFQARDLVLKWDALKEKKGNHGKFDDLWTWPFIISQNQGNNNFILQSMEGETVFDSPVNG
eukprot:PITA_24632